VVICYPVYDINTCRQLLKTYLNLSTSVYSILELLSLMYHTYSVLMAILTVVLTLSILVGQAETLHTLIFEV